MHHQISMHHGMILVVLVWRSQELFCGCMCVTKSDDEIDAAPSARVERRVVRQERDPGRLASTILINSPITVWVWAKIECMVNPRKTSTPCLCPLRVIFRFALCVPGRGLRYERCTRWAPSTSSLFFISFIIAPFIILNRFSGYNKISTPDLMYILIHRGLYFVLFVCTHRTAAACTANDSAIERELKVPACMLWWMVRQIIKSRRRDHR